ncbi:MAG: DUF4091 domain-containing protein [Clostridia bacterium]|nr:DUF4091 domain-containing protein [Clostridia bacterium]
MKGSKRILALSTALLTAASAISFSACKEEANGSVQIRSAYATLKVMQSATDFTGGDAKIDVQLAKGETESGQLILTAQGDVGSFELIESDLQTADGTKFGVDNIEVNVQKYMNVRQKTSGNRNEAYPTGWTPDMLLPMATCIEYGENAIADGNNQGLTVEFTATSETKAGVYTGSFTLKADNETYQIPVSVEVWDIDISRCYGRTWLGIEQGQLLWGELDNSDEMYKTYYDTLLNEYKSCGGMLPNTYDFDNFLATLDSYWDNPNFTTFELPTPTSWYTMDSVLFDYLYLLASNSTPDKLYLEKAIFYPFDEPQVGKDEVDDRMGVIALQIQTAKDQVWERLLAEDFFAEYEGGANGEFAAALKESLNVPSVVTSPDIDYWGDTIHTYCPPVQYYETAINRLKYSEHKAATAGGETWFYTCMQPQYPYPSHHIDDYLIGSRVMRWTQKAYDIDGYLYWAVNLYSVATDAGYSAVDVYGEPSRFYFGSQSFNGDGFLFYPGKGYNSKTPFGSLRLDALRDGQEDYNLLCTYQEQLDRLAVKYGMEKAPDVDDVMALAYGNLFTGVYYTTDDAVLFEARENLAKKAVLANKADFYYETSAGANGTTVAEFYAKTGADVYFNGEKLTGVACGDGLKFTKEFSVANLDSLDVKVVCDGEEYTFSDSLGESEMISDLSTKLSAISASEGSEVTETADGVSVKLVSKGGNAQEMQNFVPRVDLGKDIFTVALNELQTVKFTIQNTSSDDRDFTVRIAGNTPQTKLGVAVDTFRVKAGETLEVVCTNVYKSASSLNGTPTMLSIQFSNVKFDETTNTSSLYADATLLISDIVYTKRSA